MNVKHKNTLAFLMGLGSITQVRVIGAAGISELFCVFLSPFVFAKCFKIIAKTPIKWILLGLVGWFFSAVLTDFWYRQTLIESALKGCGSIIFLLGITICVFGLLHDNLQRIKYLAVGMALSAIISVFIFRPLMIESRIEMMGEEFALSYKSFLSGIYGYVLEGIVVVIYGNWPVTAFLIMVLMSLGHLIAGGSRAFFLFTFLSAWIAQMFAFFPRTIRGIQKNLILASLGVVLLGFLSLAVYKELALRGVMGPVELEKYEAQSQSKYGLLSGRSEFFGGFWVIKDSFWLGHGSWAVDYEGYYRKVFEFFEDDERMLLYEQNIRKMGVYPYITAHSHIWHGWTWHGFLGGAFWLMILVWLVRYLRVGLHLCRRLIAYNALIVLAGIWHLLFSPFADRTHWAIRFVIMAVTFSEINRRKRLQRLGMPVNPNAGWDGTSDERMATRERP